jgi:hypothetical protein
LASIQFWGPQPFVFREISNHTLETLNAVIGKPKTKITMIT